MRIRIFDDAERLAEAAAQEIESWVRLTAPNVTIGLAGGTTPIPTYRMLRKAQLPWDEVTGWMTDERFVPITDPASNAGLVSRELFDHVPARLRTIPWIEDPVAAAVEYERDLHSVLGASSSGLKPGLILLGLGDDGHTASLFPNSDALDETERDFMAHWVPQLEAWRLTATLSLLKRARRTMFLVSGASKAHIVADVLDDDSDLPAAVLNRGSKDAVWLLDRAAAGRLAF